MTGRRLPRTLFRGRVRTSTAFLALAFIGVLLLWLAVRPDPATITEEVVRVRTTRTTVKDDDPAEKRRPAEDVAPPARVEPSPVPSASRTPGVASTRKLPTVGPSAPGTTPPPPGPGLPQTPLPPGETPTQAPPPAAEPTPSRPGGGVFGLGRRDEPPPETGDTSPAERTESPSETPSRTD